MHYTNDNEKNNEQNSKICILAGNNCIEDF